MSGTALVVGASGAIGGALARQLREDGWQVWGTGRDPQHHDAGATGDERLLRLDLTDEASIAGALERVRTQTRSLDRVIVAAGVLHAGEELRPEKRLEDIDPAAMARAFAVNATGPLLVARHAFDLLRASGRSVFASLSARVGSIGDNRTGGWYAYRASKAAQNMLTRNLAHEMRNRGADTICVGLHPGTVRSDLSAPFSARLPAGQLTEPEAAARALLRVIDELTPAASGSVLDYAGRIIEP